MPDPSDNLTLHVPARIRYFDRDGRDELVQQLNADLSGTMASPPSDVESLQLNPRTGRTIKGGYRYTSVAFSRLCHATSVGMSLFVRNIAGEIRRADRQGETEISDFPLACGIFNRTIALKFAAILASYQIVQDIRKRRIEGLLGPSSIYLPNAEFMEAAESLCEGFDARFAGAELIGRAMHLHYVVKKRFRLGDDVWRIGYTYISDEGGDAALQSYRYYDLEDCGRVLEPTRHHRQRRSGTNFTDKLKKLLTSAFMDEHLGIGPIMARLQRTPVFRSRSDSGLEREAFNWMRRLKLAKMPADMAETAVNQVRGLDVGMNSPLLPHQLRQVTEYDLFRRVIRTAAGRNVRVREVVGRAAFQEFFVVGDSK